MKVEQAIELARRFHEGATDKAGRPYIEHVLRVADSVGSDDEKLVAVMHDLLEDTILEGIDLSCAGCPPHVLLAVEALTRQHDETYEAYLRRVVANPLALAVKQADMTDNASEQRLRLLDADEAGRLRAKYRHAREVLDELSAAAVPAEPSQREREAEFAAIGTPAGSDLAWVTFWCRECGRPAGTLTLMLGTSPVSDEPHLSLFLQTFLGTTGRLVDDEDAVRSAISAADAEFFRKLSFELVPFWCFDCKQTYCGTHWDHWPEFDDGFFDCFRGRCPKGHGQLLWD